MLFGNASFILSLIGLGAIRPAVAQNFPNDESWQPVQIDGLNITDPCGDVSGSAWWDIVGDAERPAAFTYDDGTYLWFRLRIAGTPFATSGGEPSRWRSFGWGAIIESDWDTNSVHYDQLSYVDGNDDSSVLAENTIGSTPWYSDSAETTLFRYDAPLTESSPGSLGFAGWAEAGSDLCFGTASSEDYFLDWAVLWEDFSNASGANSPGELGFLFGTSASTWQFSKDIAGCDNHTDDCEDYWDNVSDGDDSGDGGADDGNDGGGLTDDEPTDDDPMEGGDDGSHPLDGFEDPKPGELWDVGYKYVGGGHGCTVVRGAPHLWLLMPFALAARRRQGSTRRSNDRGE